MRMDMTTSDHIGATQAKGWKGKAFSFDKEQ
jgi:hypothetical protein